MAATTDNAGGYGASGWDPERLLDTPLGHELRHLARRILGPGPAAQEAAAAALAHPPADRIEAIANTAVECRRRHGASTPLMPPRTNSLAEAVTAELSIANASLPQREREALALRELLRLSYAQIGRVTGLEPAAVAALLAAARLHLREALRGPYRDEEAACPDRERALTVLARRQDSEPLEESDTAWLFAHMSECPGCERAHALMLEAAVRYRAWGRP
jgi:DNA-directed RNA polymerase specialized sigma24 family protein